MLLRSTLVVVFALPALISGGQIPVVNRTIGGHGVPRARRDSLDPRALAEAVSGDASRTPGKLRVVENSGVCGGSFCSLCILCHIHIFRQKLRRVSIRLPDMVICLRIRASGLCSLLSVPSVFICVPPNRFWFFAARKNPDKAPLITWFNGGVSDTVSTFYFAMLRN
jgi:hypothetical protein